MKVWLCLKLSHLILQKQNWLSAIHSDMRIANQPSMLLPTLSNFGRLSDPKTNFAFVPLFPPCMSLRFAKEMLLHPWFLLLRQVALHHSYRTHTFPRRIIHLPSQAWTSSCLFLLSQEGSNQWLPSAHLLGLWINPCTSIQNHMNTHLWAMPCRIFRTTPSVLLH